MGRPKICLSLNCKNIDEINSEIEKYILNSDIVELCADKLFGITEMTKSEYVKILRYVRFLARGKKVIVDYKGDIEVQNRILRWSMGIANIIDIDFDNPERDKLIKEAKLRLTKTLLSYHNFDGMLKRDEISELYIKMEKTKADILKIACFTNKKEDMYEILYGASRYKELKNSKDIVCISMGELGRESRICMGDFGGTISYACGTNSTAPGQFNVNELSEYLDKYYGKDN